MTMGSPLNSNVVPMPMGGVLMPMGSTPHYVEDPIANNPQGHGFPMIIGSTPPEHVDHMSLGMYFTLGVFPKDMGSPCS
jgi:hypothetical protein